MTSARTDSMDSDRSITEKEKRSVNDVPATKVVTALDWNGPDDPENPENWSVKKKAFHILYIGLQCFIM